MSIVKITNKIALTMVVLLLYWVFVFVCSSVFGFKVFRENLTEIFLLSILGIFAILSGAIILNIMFNLTAIAEQKNTSDSYSPKKPYKFILAGFLSSLMVIFLLLYLGDQATSNKKEQHLIASAAALVKEQKDIVEVLSNYTFSRDYIEKVSKNLRVLSKIEEKFPRVTVIVKDQWNAKPLLLGFGSYMSLGKKEKPEKVDYILSTSSEERKYLYSVFDGQNMEYYFSAHDGNYEIYYPVKTDKGLIVLYLSQYSRYGKIGS